MVAIQGPPPYGVAVVSCDIVGHSSVRDLVVQLEQIGGINKLVEATIGSCPAEDVVWASGGDGGHVVFRGPGWHRHALALIGALRGWSRVKDVPLRVTAHYGTVTDIGGADGRTQIVGDGINFAGWLLTRGTERGVVVSKAFRLAVQEWDPAAARFHEERMLRWKDRTEELLYLMSAGTDVSRWALPTQEDIGRLQDARARLGGQDGRRAAWEVVFRAKRIMQLNTRDPEAIGALQELEHHLLEYREGATGRILVTPFLGRLKPETLKEVVQGGQLVERRFNDVICRVGDAGDTMFVILRGQVGVYTSDEGAADPSRPAFVHQEGEIVGELAFTLSRTRTADLVALTNTAMLSFSLKDLSDKVAIGSAANESRDEFWAFVNARVLEHVSHNAPYLLGHDRTGPLATGPRSWQGTLVALRPYCDVAEPDTRRSNLDIGQVEPARDSAHRGICILAAGELRDAAGVLLRGEDAPILWVDLPDVPVAPLRTFTYESESVKVLRIGPDGYLGLDPRTRTALRDAVVRAVTVASEPERTGGRYDFDVFLCHATADAGTVARIAERLREAGIRYWLATERTPHGESFLSAMAAGIEGSRYVVACISANFRDADWAREEYEAALISRMEGDEAGSVVPLLLDDSEPPLFLRGRRRVDYRDPADFAAFLEAVAAGRFSSGDRRSPPR